MKKKILLNLFSVTGEPDLMKTEWDDDLTLRMLERRLVSVFVNEKLHFGKLFFKQGKIKLNKHIGITQDIVLGNRFLHKKTKLYNLSDQVLKIFMEVKLQPILELESTKVCCSSCMTPYEKEFCKILNHICNQCFEYL